MLVHWLPADAATRRVIDPDGAGWGVTEHLLANAIDVLRGANWQRSGGKGSKPKPIPRPGVGPARHTEHHGHTERSPAEVAAYLARFSPSAN